MKKIPRLNLMARNSLCALVLIIVSVVRYAEERFASLTTFNVCFGGGGQ